MEFSETKTFEVKGKREHLTAEVKGQIQGGYIIASLGIGSENSEKTVENIQTPRPLFVDVDDGKMISSICGRVFDLFEDCAKSGAGAEFFFSYFAWYYEFSYKSIKKYGVSLDPMLRLAINADKDDDSLEEWEFFASQTKSSAEKYGEHKLKA